MDNSIKFFSNIINMNRLNIKNKYNKYRNHTFNKGYNVQSLPDDIVNIIISFRLHRCETCNGYREYGTCYPLNFCRFREINYYANTFIRFINAMIPLNYIINAPLLNVYIKDSKNKYHLIEDYLLSNTFEKHLYSFIFDDKNMYIDKNSCKLCYLNICNIYEAYMPLIYYQFNLDKALEVNKEKFKECLFLIKHN